MNTVAKRRSLTPIAGMPPVKPGTHAMRRVAARKEVSERVLLKAEGGTQLEGWALNASTGGLRAILDHGVDLGHEFDVIVGDPEVSPARRGRIVWLQEEPDGVIVGVEYLGPAAPLESVTAQRASSPPSSAPPSPPRGT